MVWDPIANLATLPPHIGKWSLRDAFLEMKADRTFRPRKTSSFHLEKHSQPKNAKISGLTNPIFSHFLCVSPTTKKKATAENHFPPTKKKANLGQPQIFSQEVQIWRTLIFSPYILKPIFGLISDLFPIAGLHKAGFSKGSRFGTWERVFFSFGCFVLWFGVV